MLNFFLKNFFLLKSLKYISDNKTISIKVLLEEFSIRKKMHRPGIGPGPPPWQGEILPLDQRCFI